MTDRAVPNLGLWPFLLADILFLGMAALIVYLSPRPLDMLHISALITCVGAGAWCSFLPFLRRFQAGLKLQESANLQSAVEQIGQIDRVARQIEDATRNWELSSEHSNRTVEAAKSISEKMHSEAVEFGQFLESANDIEKNHLRLEVDKLRQVEKQWLQLTLHLLDHVYSLYLAGLRSGQDNVIAQLTQFKDACRELIRRIGLIPENVEPGVPYDPDQHQLPASETSPTGPAVIEDMLAPGYTFQGQPLRKPLVVISETGRGQGGGAVGEIDADADAGAGADDPVDAGVVTAAPKFSGQSGEFDTDDDRADSDGAVRSPSDAELETGSDSNADPDPEALIPETPGEKSMRDQELF